MLSHFETLYVAAKETMTYKKMLQKEEEMKRQQQAMRNVRSRQNGDVTSAARERHDVSRTSSTANRLPRNGAAPHVGNGSVIMGRVCVISLLVLSVLL